jgi:cyclic nucleotide-binding protein
MSLFKQDTKVEALKSAPLFQDLSRKELVQIARVSGDLDVSPGKVLWKEGEIGDEFFVLVEGEVEVTRKGKRVATRGGGEFFGEIALLEQIPRTATRGCASSCWRANRSGGWPTRTRASSARSCGPLARWVVELSNDPTLA